MAGASRGTGTGGWRAGLIKLAAGLALAGLTGATVVQANLRTTLEPNEAGLSGFYARLSLELESRLRTREPSTDALVTLGPGGRDVRLAGELSEGTAERLARLLDANPRVERIHLTSEGGLVEEGEAIGRQIARRGLSTYVPDYCVSACTLAFVQGRERFVVAQARLGFHAPYEEGLFGQEFQADATAERAAYVAAGVEPDFVDTALNTPSKELWIPDTDRLLAARVATEVVDLRRFPDSTLDDGADLAHARAAILRNFTLLRAFERDAPRVIEAIAAWYLDAYRAGLPEGDSVDGLRRLTANAAAQALRGSDDATVIALGRYLGRAMAQARTSDPRTCTAIGAQGNVALAHETLRGADDPQAHRLLARAASRAAQPFASDGREVVAAIAFAHAPDARGADCGAMQRAYADALARPGREAAATLRSLIFPARRPEPSLEASAQP